MAQDQVLVTCPAGEWTELTNSDATAISFQVLYGAVKVRATTGSAPSELSDPGFEYSDATIADRGSEGEKAMAISSLSSAVGADRVFAAPTNGRAAKVLVTHA